MINLACNYYKKYTAYVALSIIFLSALGISNFQNKIALASSLWIAFVFNKGNIKSIKRIFSLNNNIVLLYAILATYITIVSLSTSAGINNYVLAISLLAWIPTCEIISTLEDENLEEDSLFVSIGDLMGILFKTHKELTLGIVE